MPSYHPQPNRGDKTLGNIAVNTEKSQERFTLFQEAFANYIKYVSLREKVITMMNRSDDGQAKDHFCEQVATLRVFVLETNAFLYKTALKSSDEELP